MSDDVFAGTGQRPAVLYHPVPERNTFITADYARHAHRDMSKDKFGNPLGGVNELDAVVLYEGEPITVNNETLTVGMVPIERRWCIGPYHDGTSELMDRTEFDSAYEVWYAHNYTYRGQQPDDVSKAPKPTPRDYVSWKVDPFDSRNLLPLGIPSPNEVEVFDPVKDGSHVYDAVNDTFVASESDKDRLIRELQEKLASVTTVAPEPAEEQEIADTTLAEGMGRAICGKEVPANRVNQHAAKCSTCQDIKSKAA